MVVPRTVAVCYYCGIEKSARYRGQRVDIPRVVKDRTPCERCARLLNRGIVLIELDNDDKPKTQSVVRQYLVHNEFSETDAQEILKNGYAFLDAESWDAIELPRK